MKEKKFSILKPAKFTPECPFCKIPMTLIKIKGLKTGAWRCRKCTAEFWDKVERGGKISKKDLEKIEKMLNAKYPKLPPEMIYCRRCTTVPMIPIEDESLYCPQCESRFYKEGAPEVEKIIEQKIKCGTKNLMSWDNMSARHKSRSSRRSRRSRKRKMPFQKYYYISDENKGA